MNINDIEIILKELSCLNGEKLNTVQRAAATGMLGFGETRKKEVTRRSKDGSNATKIIDLSKYALHLQIPFRFVRGNEIILGNFDMFEPTSEMEESPDFDWEAHQDMGWDNPGKNRYDEIAKKIFVEEDYVVSNVEVSKLYDVKIFFTNECVLETFNNATDDLEFWRFFETENKEKEHLVILGTGIEVLDYDEK